MLTPVGIVLVIVIAAVFGAVAYQHAGSAADQTVTGGIIRAPNTVHAAPIAPESP